MDVRISKKLGKVETTTCELWHTDGWFDGFVDILGGTTEDHYQPVYTITYEKNFQVLILKDTHWENKEIKKLCVVKYL